MNYIQFKDKYSTYTYSLEYDPEGLYSQKLIKILKDAIIKNMITYNAMNKEMNDKKDYLTCNVLAN